MKVLFVYPENESLGIQVLSAVLKENGHETDLILDPRLFNDLEFNIKWLAKRFPFVPKVLKKVREWQPDLVAFSVVSDEYVWAAEIAQEIKKHYPHIKTVFGGMHATAVPGRVIKKVCVDFVIRGEGEYALLKLVENLDNPNKWPQIKNLVYKKDGQIVMNEVRPLIEDLSSLPKPDKELFYKYAPYMPLRYLIMSGRGCPNICTYCCNNLLQSMYLEKGKYIRRRTVEDVIEELEWAKERYKIMEVLFYDDHFIFDKDWLEEFLIAYKEKIGLPYRCLGIAGYFDEEKIGLLEKSGLCEFIQIGIQSVDRIRREICKRYDNDKKIAWTIEKLHEARIPVVVDHIFGFPTETIDDHIQTAKFYNSIRPEIVNTFWLTYYPKTEIVGIAKEHGMLNDKDIELIEEGKYTVKQGYIKSTVTKGIKRIKRFQVFFNMMPVFSKKINDFIIDKKLFNFFPTTYFFRVTLQRIILIIPKKTYRRAAIKKLGKYFYALVGRKYPV